jgi:hypothetical protein
MRDHRATPLCQVAPVARLGPKPHSVVPSDEHGLTLVELMIVVLLGGLLTAALFYMMAGQRRVYSSQRNALDLQENLAGAMTYLQKQVWLAGYSVGACGDTLHAATAVGGPRKLLDIRNNHNLFRQALGLGGVNDGTDSFSIRHGDPSTTTLTILPLSEGTLTEASTSGYFKGPEPSATIGIAQDDLVVLCAPGTGDPGSLVQVSGAPSWDSSRSAWHIPFAAGYGSYNPSAGFAFFPDDGYPAGSTYLVRLGTAETPRHFAIDNTRSSGVLVTWEGTQIASREVIATGIEDMQISWACDGNNDGLLSEGACTTDDCASSSCGARASDEWANNRPTQPASDTPPTCNDRPMAMVRITLIARTVAPVVGDKAGFRPGAEDHCKGAPSDDLAATGNLGTYGRAVLTSKIQPKNISLTQP